MIVPGLDAEAAYAEGDGDLQGPHNWRKSLRPVNSPNKVAPPTLPTLEECAADDLRIAVSDSPRSSEPSPRSEQADGDTDASTHSDR